MNNTTLMLRWFPFQIKNILLLKLILKLNRFEFDDYLSISYSIQIINDNYFQSQNRFMINYLEFISSFVRHILWINLNIFYL